VRVRTWNLNLGSSLPPTARSLLRPMVELITAGEPGAVCLQEVPAWALGSLGDWAGMQEVPARATRPHAGPLPAPAAVGKLLSTPHSGRLSGAFTGAGNSILIPAAAHIRDVKTVTLNTNVFCEERGAALGLSRKQMRVWERPRRICHLVHYELPNRRRYLVATLQATSYPSDTRLADAELRRAVGFVDRHAEVEETVIVAGDFNIKRAQSQTIADLESAPPEFRWTDSGARIDDVLLRRAVANSARRWSDEERTRAGRLLSDHAPVEVELEER
jgi:endonuclease/exonuclease/phosphatase family metal-dependent hydrolase